MHRFGRRAGIAAAIAVAAITVLALLGRGRIDERAGSRQVTDRLTALENAAAGATARTGRPAEPATLQSKPSKSGRRQFEVCGIGKVEAGPDGSEVGPMLEHLAEPVYRRWLSRARGSDVYRARAAGLLLTSEELWMEGARQAMADGAAEAPADPGDVSRRVAQPDPDASSNAALLAVAETRDELVQLAAGADDPAIYAMALNGCGKPYSSQGACQRLSNAEWARMEADNAVPWLLLAGEARQRKDSSAEADAFGHAASARRLDSYTDLLLTFAESDMPADATPLIQAHIGILAVGAAAAIPQPILSISRRHCSAAALRDDEVRRQCSALADLMVAKARTLLDFASGVALGKQVGWPAARVDALTTEKEALFGAFLAEIPSTEQPWSCDSVNRSNRWLQERARLGELNAAREELKRSEASTGELAQRYRNFVDDLQGGGAHAAPSIGASSSE